MRARQPNVQRDETGFGSEAEQREDERRIARRRGSAFAAAVSASNDVLPASSASTQSAPERTSAPLCARADR